MNQNIGKRTETFAIKARQRQAIKDEEKRHRHLQLLSVDARSQLKAGLSKSRTQQIESEFKKRVFEERYIFVLADHQDLFSMDNLKLIKVEINNRLCRMIP